MATKEKGSTPKMDGEENWNIQNNMFYGNIAYVHSSFETFSRGLKGVDFGFISTQTRDTQSLIQSLMSKMFPYHKQLKEFLEKNNLTLQEALGDIQNKSVVVQIKKDLSEVMKFFLKDAISIRQTVGNQAKKKNSLLFSYTFTYSNKQNQPVSQHISTSSFASFKKQVLDLQDKHKGRCSPVVEESSLNTLEKQINALKLKYQHLLVADGRSGSKTETSKFTKDASKDIRYELSVKVYDAIRKALNEGLEVCTNLDLRREKYAPYEQVERQLFSTLSLVGKVLEDYKQELLSTYAKDSTATRYEEIERRLNDIGKDKKKAITALADLLKGGKSSFQIFAKLGIAFEHEIQKLYGGKVVGTSSSQNKVTTDVIINLGEKIIGDLNTIQKTPLKIGLTVKNMESTNFNHQSSTTTAAGESFVSQMTQNQINLINYALINNASLTNTKRQTQTNEKTGEYKHAQEREESTIIRQKMAVLERTLGTLVMTTSLFGRIAFEEGKGEDIPLVLTMNNESFFTYDILEKILSIAKGEINPYNVGSGLEYQLQNIQTMMNALHKAKLNALQNKKITGYNALASEQTVFSQIYNINEKYGAGLNAEGNSALASKALGTRLNISKLMQS